MEPPHQLRIPGLLRPQLRINVGQAGRLCHPRCTSKTADRKRMYPVLRHVLAPFTELSTTATYHQNCTDEYYLASYAETFRCLLRGKKRLLRRARRHAGSRQTQIETADLPRIE